MKLQVRIGVFETNSSSVHTMSIVSKEKFDAFKKGDYVYDHWTDELIKKEDIKTTPMPEVETFEQYTQDEYLATYAREYTTDGGETIVIFGKYGYNG